MFNRTLSFDEVPEISSFQAKVGSLRRRFTNPLRRQNRLERRAIQSTKRAGSNAMSKNKNRRREANGDWEASETEESFSSKPDYQNATNQAEIVMDEDDNMNSYINNNNGGKTRRKRDGGTAQQRQRQSLGQWPGIVNDAVQKLGTAQKVLEVVEKQFAAHKEEIESIAETSRRVIDLQEECRNNESKVQQLEISINTLTRMSLQKEKEFAQQRVDNERERKELESHRAKLEKRNAVTLAEAEKKLKAVYEELANNQDESYSKRKKELEDRAQVQEDEHNKTLVALESENKRLSAMAEDQEEILSSEKEKLENSEKHRDLLERAIDSHKKEKEARENELEKMKKEFALSSISKDDFKQRFAQIYKIVEDISFRYFHGMDEKSPEDLEEVSRVLVAADPCFEAVPIDESDDSSGLRSAHAQRILSEAIYENIWKPFRSDFTSSHPEFNDVLAKMSQELERGSHGGRSSRVWAALTMRALHNLSTESDISGNLALSEEHPQSSRSGRIGSVISGIVKILSPLVNTSQNRNLRVDLAELIKRAIDVWDEVQTSELRISVTSLLDRTDREDWRSQTFDPPLELDRANSDIRSETYPRIFTLFPRIVVKELVDPIQNNANLPGSWPGEATQGPQMVETCIHPGVGLPQWSPLVLRGIAAQDEKKEIISRAVEDAKVQYNSKRIAGHGRKDSVGSVISAPSSPIKQWKSGVATKYT